MSVIGIVSVPTKNKSFKERFFKAAEIKETFGENPRYMVAELPYCADYLMRLKKARQQKVLKKAAAVLKAAGAEKVIFTKECKALLPYGEPAKTVKIPPRKMGECILFTLEKLAEFDQSRVYNSLVIYDSDLKAVSYKMLSAVCGRVKYISLYTQQVSEAVDMCDKVFRDYGVCIAVTNSKQRHTKPRQITADVDKGRVGTGDFVINGIEILCDTGEYHIDAYDLTDAVLSGDSCAFEVENWICGKNKLKSS